MSRITQEKKYVLSCDLSQEKSNDFYQNMQCFLALNDDSNKALNSLRKRIDQQMDTPLIEFVLDQH